MDDSENILDRDGLPASSLDPDEHTTDASAMTKNSAVGFLTDSDSTIGFRTEIIHFGACRENVLDGERAGYFHTRPRRATHG